MAQRLLDSLPKVPKDQLPTGAECMICKEEYGTVPSDNGTVEHAVWLPCLHHVGSECIAIWLSPGDGLGNSCPLCRTVFFENYLRDYDDEDEDGDGGYGDSDDSGGDDDGGDEEEGSEEGDEDGSDEGNDEDEGDGDDDPEHRRQHSPMTFVAHVRRLQSSSVNNTRSRQQPESQNIQTRFRRGPSAPTTQPIEDSAGSAPSQLLRPKSSPPPPPSSSAFPHQSPPTQSQSQSPPPPPIIPDSATKTNQFASADCTLAFGQASLYMNVLLIIARMTALADVKGGAECGCSSAHSERDAAAAVGAGPKERRYRMHARGWQGFIRGDEQSKVAVGCS